MDNFVFKVYDIRSAGDDFSLFRGKHYSGTIKHNERIRFAGRTGGFDSIIEGDTNTTVGSFNPNPTLDFVIMNTPYSGQPYNAKDKHIWIIDAENNPSMVVDGTFDIAGRGIVATGIVASGVINVGSKMQIIAPDGIRRKVQVSGIERFSQLVDTANVGDAVGVLLSGIKNRHEIPEGSLLCSESSTTISDQTPSNNMEAAFNVADTFYIEGHGVIVDGTTLTSKISLGEHLQYNDISGKRRNVQVKSIVKGEQFCDSAHCGEYVGILLQGIKDVNEISIGTQLYIAKHPSDYIEDRMMISKK